MFSSEILERFWVKVDFKSPNECWEWTASKTLGYGRFRVNGRLDMAHRVAWSIENGPIKGDLTVDHLCFNRGCVNPAHLRLLTRTDNAKRKPPGYVNPSKPQDFCAQGHDTRAPDTRSWGGGCLICMRKYKREYMRRARAAGKYV